MEGLMGREGRDKMGMVGLGGKGGMGWNGKGGIGWEECEARDSRSGMG